MKNELLLLTAIFRNYIDSFKSVYRIDPLYSYSSPGLTLKAGVKHTGIRLDYITDDKLRLLLENNMQGVLSSCMGNRHVKRGERKLIFGDLNNLCGWSMSQYLPKGVFHESKYANNFESLFLKTFLKTLGKKNLDTF